MRKIKQTIQQTIAEEIQTNCTVLDLGCGNGNLLQFLQKNKKVKGLGIEIDYKAIIKCIEKGLSVIQLDLDNLPLDFPDKSYDYTILNQTITQITNPKLIIDELLRVGKTGILGFANFGCLDLRLRFLFSGKMPDNDEHPFKWYETPNIHFLTIKDFYDFCKENNITVKKKIFLKKRLFTNDYKEINKLVNLRADLALFLLTK